MAFTVTAKNAAPTVLAPATQGTAQNVPLVFSTASGNAIVLGETGVLNNALRFEDEFVRHKILDAIGDLALVGHAVVGHLVAHRAGHALHTEFAAKILEETSAWRLVEAPFEGVVLPAAATKAAVLPRLAN